MPPILDKTQLRRIENVHGGFLYQHLYAVAILLSGPRIGWRELSVERDEDIEAELPEQRIYIQVKKRAGNLTFGDISEALDRFARIREQHQSNQRACKPLCWIISNAEPGPDLARRLQTEWPADVSCVRLRSAPAIQRKSLYLGAPCLRCGRRVFVLRRKFRSPRCNQRPWR